MTDYTELENLSDEDILNTYDDVVLISAYQYHCLCKCRDGYEFHYTCSDGIACGSGTAYSYYSSRCADRCSNSHGGFYSLTSRPDSTDVCCTNSSCWRYSITEW